MLDISPRMVELAAGRGVDAGVGDVQHLPFEDATFDCAVAAWMLFHVPDIDRGLGELARVLRPGGPLVAVTNARDAHAELRALAGRPSWLARSTRENGAEILGGTFAESSGATRTDGHDRGIETVGARLRVDRGATRTSARRASAQSPTTSLRRMALPRT